MADEILRLVAGMLQGEVKDFDLSAVTLIRCEVSHDLAEASLRYSVLGDEDKRREAADALGHVAGFLQRRVGESLGLRQTPHLRFSYDSSQVESVKLQELFDQIARERDNDAKS